MTEPIVSHIWIRMLRMKWKLSFFCLNVSPFLSIQSLYDSIKTEPFKIPEDDGNDLMHTFFNPDREGWLWKQGKF